MVDFSALISRIEAAVYENGVQAITGQILQDCLKDVVNTINVQKQDGIYHITVTVDGTSGTPSGTARMDDETYTLELSFSGLKGEVGPAGPQGEKGDKGDTGERGLQGPTGATGAQGPIGPVGPQGIQGERGPAGTNGEDGVGITDIRQTSTSEEAYGQNVVTITLSDGTSKSFVVRNGGAGPQGATGPQGVKGDTGAAGVDGVSITDVEQIASPSGSGAANIVRITRSNGVATDVTIRNGQQGATGPQGPQGPAGTDATVTRSSINTALGYVPPSPEDAKDVMWAQYGTDTPAAIHAAVEDEKIVRVLWANNICELVEDDWADRTYKFACIDPTTTELIVLTCTNNGWTNTTVPIAGGTDIDTVNVTVDNNTGTPSATGSVSGNTLTLAFHNLKGATGPQGPKGDTGETGATGAQGPKGDTGDTGATGPAGANGTSAGFGTPTASVDANIGPPSVQVTASGPNTAKVFNFAFRNLGSPVATDTQVQNAVDDWLDDHKAEIDGLSYAARAALMNLLLHVAYIDDKGREYYDALYDALFPDKTLTGITATFNQGSAVIYDSDNLDALKPYLTVVATYDDMSTEVITNYTLAGELTTGTSTITVLFGGYSDTFDVTVTHATVQYSITNNLTDVTTNNPAVSINELTAYAAQLTAASGYVIDSVTVLMGGNDITAQAYDNGTISIPSVTGNIVITATAAEDVGWISGVPYDMSGYTDNKYLDNGVETAYNGWAISPYLPIKGAFLTSDTAFTTQAYNALYDAEKTYTGGKPLVPAGTTPRRYSGDYLRVSEARSKVVNAVITPYKLPTLTESSTIATDTWYAYTPTKGQYVNSSNGNVVTHNDYECSDFLNCFGMTSLTFNQAGGTWGSVVFFDGNKNYISGQDITSWNTVTIPSGARYVRISTIINENVAIKYA